MNTLFDEIICHHARPLKPIPTGEPPLLRQLSGIRAVMFDIYGTLLISASGDIGASDSTTSCGSAMVEALSVVGIQFLGNGDAGVRRLVETIQTAHALARKNGIEFPEVDIVEIWRQVVSRIFQDNLATRLDPKQAFVTSDATDANHDLNDVNHDLADVNLGLSDVALKRLALEYEMRVNPVWPMPHARECLDKIRELGLCLGIISNAQFFTKEILQTLIPVESKGFEFDQKLQYYSYQHGQAKPGLALYELALESLAQIGIRASEVLYVGNDMLNDVLPAASIGFRTALFAGDARSLRRRKDDSRVDGVAPDLVITDLSDVPKCI